MKRLRTSNMLPLGFAVSAIFFLAANCISYRMVYSRSLTREFGVPIGEVYGFPFTYYYRFGGAPVETDFALVEALVNLSIAVVVSLGVGIAARKVVTRRLG